MENNKLDRKIFIQGMEYLNAYYVNLKIDLDNKVVIQVWYDVFSKVDNETFTELIKEYSLNNVYPPSSPTSLLEYRKEITKKKLPSPATAFDRVLSAVRKARYLYDKVENLNELEKRTLKDCEVHFEKFRNDISYHTYLFREFEKAYTNNISNNVNESVNDLLLTSNKNKLLE